MSRCVRAELWSAALAALIWTTLALRLWLVAEPAARAGDSPWLAALASFGYFTLLSALLAGLSVTARLLPSSLLARMGFARLAGPGFASLVATSLVMLALVYTLVLRHQWQPQGLRLLVDSLLHDVIPLAFLLHWWFFAPKSALKYRHLFGWVCYPALYLLVVMLLGPIRGWYPYPFLDVPELGMLRVGLNAFGLVLFYGAIGMSLVGVARRRERKKAPR